MTHQGNFMEGDLHTGIHIVIQVFVKSSFINMVTKSFFKLLVSGTIFDHTNYMLI